MMSFKIALNISDATFERLKSILAPDGSVVSKINNDKTTQSSANSANNSLLTSLVRPLQYRTMKLSTPLINRKEGWRTGVEIEL